MFVMVDIKFIRNWPSALSYHFQSFYHKKYRCQNVLPELSKHLSSILNQLSEIDEKKITLKKNIAELKFLVYQNKIVFKELRNKYSSPTFYFLVR